MAELSQDVLEECAYIYAEDLIFECILDSDEPLRTTAVVAWLRERGLDVSPAFLRGFFQESTQFVSDGRRWDLACRAEAEQAAMDGAIRAILRGRGRPMPLQKLCDQVALVKTLGPKEARATIETLIVSRPVYFRTDNGLVGLSEWLLKVEGGDEEEVLLDNFFDESSEADAIIEAFDSIRADDDAQAMRNVLDVVGCPASVKGLQFACWKRAPEQFDAVAHLVALLSDGSFIVSSDHQTIPAHYRDEMMALVLAASAAQGDAESAELEMSQEAEFQIEATDAAEAVAIVQRSGRSLTSAQLLMELYEIREDDPGFDTLRAELEELLDQVEELVCPAPGRYAAPGIIPAGLDHVPPNLAIDTVAVVALSGEEVDVELEDAGLDGDLPARIHDPEREDVGEEHEVVVDSGSVGTPEAITWVVPYHHYLSGTIKIRKIDGAFYGGREGLADCVLHYEQGQQTYVCWANLDLGLVFGLREFYKAYCPPSGAVLRVSRRSSPGEFSLHYDGESDPGTLIDPEHLEALLKLRAEAEARRLSVLDIMCSLLPFHEEGATLERIHAEVNAIRRTARRLVASVLSYYQCFHPRGRHSDLWIFDERKVELGRSRSKKKHVIARSKGRR